MELVHDIAEDRRVEYEGIVDLMMAYADPGDAEAPAVADRIARAALQPEHLWRSMGLENRAALRTLFETHFPGLAVGNDKDMRWKKYLYKRLCGWPGFHVCTQPSCEVCPDYAECFGPED